MVGSVVGRGVGMIVGTREGEKLIEGVAVGRGVGT